ncbi:hypothetical protein HDU97_005769 [Phlyctochytrium planicorne]|nr:hypothetical protein HDU97_005769 [Phlyctochytrium planicorne]
MLLINVLTAVLTAASVVVADRNGSPFKSIVTFGDSFSDSGNQYKVTGGRLPPSPPNFNGRNSNGILW